MLIKNEYPPNYGEIQIKIGVDESDLPMFTYGDTIYNPGNKDISANLIVHEEVHKKQQGDDPAAWWRRYLSDVQFRLDEELMAYAIQYAFIKRNFKTKGQKYFLDKMSEYLSGPMYGDIISYSEAETKIRKLAKMY